MPCAIIKAFFHGHSASVFIASPRGAKEFNRNWQVLVVNVLSVHRFVVSKSVI